MAGTGTVTAVTNASFGTSTGQCMTLPRYAHITQVSECALFGVNNPDDPSLDCRTAWTQSQRDWLERYLLEAQQEIEEVVNFPLCKTWIANEQRPFHNPVQSKWGNVIEGGVRASATIQAGAGADHTNDPAEITVSTSVTDSEEIVIYHPGTEIPIIPSSISIASGTATILIPRCRMVTLAARNNDKAGLSYSNLANFESTVDVVRVYNDPSTQAVIVWPHSCGASCSVNGCTERTQSACIYVRHPEVGSLSVQPAVYSGGSWQARALTCCGRPGAVRLNYRAGVSPTLQMEDVIIRLAHSKMPSDFCSSCDIWSRFHKRDNRVPDVLTRERLNCPFGLSDGAWIAWRFTQQFRLVRGFVF